MFLDEVVRKMIKSRKPIFKKIYFEGRVTKRKKSVRWFNGSTMAGAWPGQRLCLELPQVPSGGQAPSTLLAWSS